MHSARREAAQGRPAALAVAAQVAHGEPQRAERLVARRSRLGHRRPLLHAHDRLGEADRVGACRSLLEHQLSAAQHGDPIGDAEHLG